MKIGTAEASPGTLARGYVELGSYPDAPLVSPVMVARGRRDGPVLYVQNLVHGPEVVGPIATARFLRALDLDALRGTVIGLMVANPLGFRGRDRLTPQDGMNLNRVFPGKPDGSVSEQLAHRLLGLADAHGDVLLDLHSGGDLTITAFYVIYAKGESAAAEESRRLSACVGSRFQWGSNEGWLKGASFANFTRKCGKPALIVESGGGARVTDQDLANFETALTGLCRGLGLLPGDPPTATDVRHGGNALHLKAREGGFWHPRVTPGDDLSEGQVLGEVVDAFGDVAESIRCPFPRAWVGSIRRPYMPIYNGDQVMEVVEAVAP